MSTILHSLRRKIKFELQKAGILQRESFALNELDLKLSKYLKRRNGFYIEAGANDGITQSNTAYFERYLGWRGILIEAIPEIAEKCRANRPRAIVEHCALVPFDFLNATVELEFCNLMSMVRGARGSEELDAAHFALGRTYLPEETQTYTVHVKGRTLTSVLDAHNVKNIDLLSLDVEGYEGPVLRGLDFDRYVPTYILVEANVPEEIEEILDGRYDLVAHLSHHDRLYRAI